VNQFGASTDPSPYILAAYLLGFIFVFGYASWLYYSRLRTERYLAALTKDV